MSDPPGELTRLTEVAVPPDLRRDDDAARQVYADLLEEQGRTLEHEWLRVEQALWVAPVAEQDALRARLCELRVPAAFREAMTRAPVENCAQRPCHASWERLSLTDRSGVRTCMTCSSEVHFAESTVSARTLLRAGKRVALSPEIDSAALDGEGLGWAEFVSTHPRWSDAAETCAPFAGSVEPLSLEPHPLFSAWRQELSGWPVSAALTVPSLPREPWEPQPEDSFARGRVAFLEDDAWPTCARCSRGLELCVQLSPAAMTGWLGDGKGLVVMYCFHCRDDHGCVRQVHPRVRVDAPASAASEWNDARLQARAVPVTVARPKRRIPSTGWFRFRSEVTPGTAASALFGFERVELEAPLSTEGVALEEAWDEWTSAGEGQGPDFLGGVAHWDQGDRTPRCAHGEMQHLLDFNGNQFLDGALHVFSCRDGACAMALVAEF